MTTTVSRFIAAIDALDCRGGALRDWPASLMMRRSGDWAVYYAPFDHVNVKARVVLVGITPGLQQAGNALYAFQREIRAGKEQVDCLAMAKSYASFSGPMRQNLIDLLDAVGVQRWLGLSTTMQLFGDRADLVHYTSALRYPVTRGGQNYSGTPSIASNDFTRRELDWFAEEVAQIPEAVYVPLGSAVERALEIVVDAGLLRPDHVLAGLPHPSGANAERIAYFVGRKPRGLLSNKTDPDKPDSAKQRLIDKVRQLESHGRAV